MEPTSSLGTDQPSPKLPVDRGSWLRHSPWDAWLLFAAALHGAAFALLIAYHSTFPTLLVIFGLALGLCWNANTIAHNHLHNPLWHSRALNRAFDLYLSLLLGIPQVLWKERHLWHHAGEPAQWRYRRWWSQKGLQGLAILALWVGLAWWLPAFFFWLYLPGYLLGLGLCSLQGRYEHVRETTRGMGVSYYNRCYNFFWFNDGYHTEHHLFPRCHWSEISRQPLSKEQLSISAFPPLLRWIADLPLLLNRLQSRGLGHFERLALRSNRLQRWLISVHQRAFSALLLEIPETRRQHVVIVGGGLFPRTLLALLDLLPQTAFTIIEKETTHIQEAQTVLQTHPNALDRVSFVKADFMIEHAHHADILILPLAFVGDRAALYRQIPTPYAFIHDWIWQRKTPKSASISWWLLKRLNLVEASSL